MSFTFRKLDDGRWQRRRNGGPWETLSVRFVNDRVRGVNAPKTPRWKWSK